MIVIKAILKILVLSVILILILMQWIGTFCTGIVEVILGILSFLFRAVAILGYLKGICSGHEAWQMILIAFIAFLIPHICVWFIERIIDVRFILADFLGS